ncbi:unnamed protein product [Blepharisma stoltei]|uniref:Uncharacterized protein n=1 Tax=Blepharisma stoltei TaxID=1481888 RepID=A0AAU9IPY9_9CILI|nr:unnamed protein product [Blepharisma stoltei]
MKKGKAPAHQNTFAFKHNKASRLTKKIEGEPLTYLCRRCYAKLEWRKKFRKFKLRTVPAKCLLCEEKSVVKGHRKICDVCARGRNLCSKCAKEPYSQGNESTTNEETKVEETKEIEAAEVEKSED